MKSRIVCELPSSPGNPRNSEGSFLNLKAGRIAFYFPRYYGNSGDDDATADIAVCHSCDQGESWSAPEVLMKGPANGNFMSVSTLRLQDGRLMLMYLRKQRLEEYGVIDCRPQICFSSDEGKTWTDPQSPIRTPGYFVIHNDRLVQLSGGRILMPAAFSNYVNGMGISFVYYSDDGGASWNASGGMVYTEQDFAGLQEPGVIELKDGTLICWHRTPYRCQFQSFSHDFGYSWTPPEKAPAFPSHCAPLSMKRNPVTDRYLAVWNDLDEQRWGRLQYGKTRQVWERDRSRLVLAQSDDGIVWKDHEIVEFDPECGFCYTAIGFLEDGSFLLAYCCGGHQHFCLQDLRIRKFTLN